MTGIFTYAYFTGLLVGSVIRVIYSARFRGNRKSGRRRARDPLLLLPFLGMIVTPVAYLVTPWLDFANYALPLWAGLTGVFLFATALWLLWRSHADLGHNWSPLLEIREEQTLVTSGVFRRIRHPMYAAHLLWAIAQPLLLQNWIAGGAMLVAFVPVCWVRVSREEQLMLDRFGDEYRAYMQQTGRLVPPLWRL